MAVVSGGTTLIDNGALDPAVPTGSLILLSTQTASGSANISFTSGIDSTYDSYVFKFINIHPSVDGAELTFNMSTDGGSTYAVTKTSTHFSAIHAENDTDTQFFYSGSGDLAQSTANQIFLRSIGTDNDQNACGQLQIFNPSSSVFVKHYIGTSSSSANDDYSRNGFTAGYGNTTSPINAVRFQMSSGNIDDGIIKMYGVK